MNKEEQKRAFQEALDAWLDKQWARFGKWTAAGVASWLTYIVVKYLFTHNLFRP